MYEDFLELLEVLKWGRILKGDFVDRFLIGRISEEIVTYAIIGHNPKGGVYLNGGDVNFQKIDYVLEWVEVKQEHRGKGYGKAIVSYIRDEYMSKRIPIALYAECRNASTHAFYYKLGAVYLCAEHTCSDYFVFLHRDQIEEYMPEDYKETVKFYDDHTLRKVCCAKHICEGEHIFCDWMLKDCDSECDGCSENRGHTTRGDFCDEMCPCMSSKHVKNELIQSGISIRQNTIMSSTECLIHCSFCNKEQDEVALHENGCECGFQSRASDNRIIGFHKDGRVLEARYLIDGTDTLRPFRDIVSDAIDSVNRLIADVDINKDVAIANLKLFKTLCYIRKRSERYAYGAVATETMLTILNSKDLTTEIRKDYYNLIITALRIILEKTDAE